MVDPELAERYRQAYTEWQEQLSSLHEFLLEGKKLDPVRIKGLLNREAQAKQRYDRARRQLLGIDDAEESEDGAEEAD